MNLQFIKDPTSFKKIDSQKICWREEHKKLTHFKLSSKLSLGNNISIRNFRVFKELFIFNKHFYFTKSTRQIGFKFLI